MLLWESSSITFNTAHKISQGLPRRASSLLRSLRTRLLHCKFVESLGLLQGKRFHQSSPLRPEQRSINLLFSTAATQMPGRKETGFERNSPALLALGNRKSKYIASESDIIYYRDKYPLIGLFFTTRTTNHIIYAHEGWITTEVSTLCYFKFLLIYKLFFKEAYVAWNTTLLTLAFFSFPFSKIET